MGCLYVVGTPIGNISDITFRAVEVLKKVDFILVEDTRNTMKLLNKYDIKRPMVSYHKFNEKSRSVEVIDKIKNGCSFALVTDAGTPCISDPGYILVNECRRGGIDVIAIPGASAAICALSISGLSTNNFSFIGFLPLKNIQRTVIFNDMKGSGIKTFVLYESPKRLVRTIDLLKHEFPSAIVAICSDITKLHERVIFGNIDEVYERILSDEKIEKGEYVIVIQIMDSLKIGEERYSFEAMLVDYMVKNNVTLREAMNGVAKNNSNVSKKELYQARLNLKKLI